MAGLLDHRLFQSPALRHLAWMCCAPQLLNSPLTLRPEDWLCSRSLATLLHWEAEPGSMPAALRAAAPSRLGAYFEELYRCLMEDLLGWQVLASNLPVYRGGRSLGELDFLLRNPHTGQVEHHEIAVKFYLGASRPLPAWYGPDARDRLDIKTNRLLNHQSKLTLQPETRDVLAPYVGDEPITARIFMPGYLFYPPGGAMQAPAAADAHHLRGAWLYSEAVREQDSANWVPLYKPHWIGDWQQEEAPDPEQCQAALEKVEATRRAQLFARVQADDSGRWREVERFFVVPAEWPVHRNRESSV